MKKFLSLILVFLLLVSVSGFCLAVSFDVKGSSISIDDIEIKIPDELKKKINDTDTEELTNIIKDKLDYVKTLSDDEIYEFTKEFCEKYSIELNDDQIKKVAQYIKSASEFDINEIREKVESAKNALSVMQQILNVVKGVAVKVKDVAVLLFNGFKDLFGNFIKK